MIRQREKGGGRRRLKTDSKETKRGLKPKKGEKEDRERERRRERAESFLKKHWGKQNALDRTRTTSREKEEE